MEEEELLAKLPCTPNDTLCPSSSAPSSNTSSLHSPDDVLTVHEHMTFCEQNKLHREVKAALKRLYRLEITSDQDFEEWATHLTPLVAKYAENGTITRGGVTLAIEAIYRAVECTRSVEMDCPSSARIIELRQKMAK